MSETERARIERVTLALDRERPRYSARKTFSSRQLLFLHLIATTMLAASAWEPVLAASVFVGFFVFFYLASFLLKTLLFIIGPAPRPETPPSPLTDDALPLYTILVPLYRERRTLPALIEALTALDYPPGKLDVKLLLEADDRDTASGLSAFVLPAHFEIVTVPLFQPRTKPNDCVPFLASL